MLRSNCQLSKRTITTHLTCETEACAGRKLGARPMPTRRSKKTYKWHVRNTSRLRDRSLRWAQKWARGQCQRDEQKKPYKWHVRNTTHQRTRVDEANTLAQKAISNLETVCETKACASCKNGRTASVHMTQRISFRRGSACVLRQQSQTIK